MQLDDTLPGWVADTDIPRDLGGTLRITATPRRETGDTQHLVYPRASPLASAASAVPTRMIAIVDAAVVQADIATAAIAGVFSLDLKADEAAVHALAAGLGVAAGSLTLRR